MILVDSNVLLDILDEDPVWLNWSLAQLRRCAVRDELATGSEKISSKSPARSLRFYVTDSVEKFKRLGTLFLGEPIANISHVDLRE